MGKVLPFQGDMSLYVWDESSQHENSAIFTGIRTRSLIF